MVNIRKRVGSIKNHAEVKNKKNVSSFVKNSIMKKCCLVLAIIWLLPVHGQRKIEFTEYDLPNGLHVILHEEHSTPIVAVTVLYHVGSKNENPERTGFAHFFEHLLFEGSQNIDRGEYSELVEKNGGVLNANTSQDRTFYYEILPSNQLELGLWMESERMLHARVEKKGIETQRSVVKEEKRQRYDNEPYATFVPELFKRLFPSHPYRWTPIGSMEHLDAAQEVDYVNFYKTFYVPSNATLTIAGDLNVEQTKKWIEKYFGTIPKGESINVHRDFYSMDEEPFVKKYGISKKAFSDTLNPLLSMNPAVRQLAKTYSDKEIAKQRVFVDKEPLTGVIKDIVYDNIQSPGIFMAYKFPEQTHPDSYAIEMLNEVLSGSTSSRMNKEVVEKKRLAIYAFSYNFALESGGAGLFGAIASQDVQLDSIQEAIDIEIKRIQNELISEEEFQKVRNQFENNIVRSNTTVAGIAENLADNHVYFGSAGRINKMLDIYLNVTREDIQRVANMYLTQDRRVILHYLPKESN
jgi:zinc protease